MKPMVFKIRTEHHAQRCELCHQKDQFDLETGVCARCLEIQNTEGQHPLAVSEFQVLKQHRADLKLNAFFAACFGLVLTFFFLFGTDGFLPFLLIPLVAGAWIYIGLFIGGCLAGAVPIECPQCHQLVPIHDQKMKEGESLLCVHCQTRLS